MLPAAYDDADQLRSAGSCVYHHDQAGNLVARNGGDQPPLQIAYDALGRAVEVHAGDDIVTFTYDGLGRRVARTSKAGTTARVFDSASLIAEIADDGTATTETSAGMVVLHRDGPSGRRFLHADANTNVSEVTDETGTVLAHFTYGPFGTPTAAVGDTEAAGPLGFCGTIGVRAETAGLLDMRARLYDPSLGRFTSPDPWPAYLPDPVTLNRYLYALGDPILQVDPLGLFCWMGSKHGKCKGLKDVAGQVGDVAKGVADFAEQPLSAASKVAAGVAVLAAGVTVLCPVPCGPVSGLGASWAGTASYATGLAAGGLHCVNKGFATFDCATSVATAAISTASRHLFRTAARAFEPFSKEFANQIRFGGSIFSLFRAGASAAAARRK